MQVWATKELQSIITPPKAQQYMYMYMYISTLWGGTVMIKLQTTSILQQHIFFITKAISLTWDPQQNCKGNRKYASRRVPPYVNCSAGGTTVNYSVVELN